MTASFPSRDAELRSMLNLPPSLLTQRSHVGVTDVETIILRQNKNKSYSGQICFVCEKKMLDCQQQTTTDCTSATATLSISFRNPDMRLIR